MSTLATAPGSAEISAVRRRLIEPQQGVLAIFILLEIIG